MDAAHPDAMRPSRPGPTRTAPPRGLAGYPWAHPRYRRYILYAATSIVFLIEGLLLLSGLIALGDGPAAWADWVTRMGHPAYVAWHVFVLGVVVWFGARTYFKLFVKTQPPILPLPPLHLIPPILGVVWLGVTAVLVAILGGWIP